MGSWDGEGLYMRRGSGEEVAWEEYAFEDTWVLLTSQATVHKGALMLFDRRGTNDVPRRY